MKWVLQILVFTNSFKAEFEKALSPTYTLVKIAKSVQSIRISKRPRITNTRFLLRKICLGLDGGLNSLYEAAIL